MQENRSSNYTDVGSIKKEVEDSKNLFKKYSWPTIDVTRKSVEETAASIIKIIEIKKKKMKIVLASKSGVRKEILDKYGVESIVSPVKCG